eukprot:CAMPEP_0201118610 /NCGR_PEP_ID=MMETSP0850-20130426/2798_1 /ASSEMBLY_ACC=CAM_ASM_000622 /TAXON_ID=183588 /ORGANISM="Pseudo-nitzschia fraudulenta, Strain WWA7" /LENGTH=702 /DNA_ID=CAMNT_0047383929 /DNA_START=160 /DNA_END=2268 /DNA_ORIENTATION=+
MRRVSSRQRLVSWDAFDATAAPGSGKCSEASSPLAANAYANTGDGDGESLSSYASGYETALSETYYSSTALDKLGEVGVGVVIDAPLKETNDETKNGTRRRKRDRKSLRSRASPKAAQCAVGSPKPGDRKAAPASATPDVTARKKIMPTIVPSSSWEISKPEASFAGVAASSSGSTVSFDSLFDDAHIHVFSFLDLPSLRSVMSVDRHYRRLLQSGDAKIGLWMNHCDRLWNLSLWNLQRNGRDQPLPRFVDGCRLPIGAASAAATKARPETSDETMDKHNTNLSLLLSLTPPDFPTRIDEQILEPRTRLSRVIQQTIPSYRLVEEDQLVRSYSDPSTGRRLVRYTGVVGQGDRCIRGNHPLPRPARTAGYNESPIGHDSGSNPGSKTHLAALGAALLGTTHPHIELHRPFLLNILRNGPKCMLRDSSRSFKSSSPSSSSASQAASSDWIPFVVPFVDQDTNKTTATTINVTPRFVSYFEVDILKPEDSESNNAERPTPRGPISRHRVDCVAVGVAKKHFEYQTRMPGWDSKSYGYHGDDGGIFHSSGGMVKQFGPKFGAGDTVGCGIDYVKKGIFYTLNGEFLGYGWKNLSEELLKTDLFPVVGVDTNSPIHLNLGTIDSGAFRFDLSAFIKDHQKTISTKYSHSGSVSSPGSGDSNTAGGSATGTASSAVSPQKKNGRSRSSSRRRRKGLARRLTHRERK